MARRRKLALPIEDSDMASEFEDGMDDPLSDPIPSVCLADLLFSAYEEPIEDVSFDSCPIGLGLPGERFDLKCPECNGDLRLRRSKHGVFYGCENWTSGCKGSHGAHPDGRPLGSPANAATKKARMQAHRLFDRLWQPYGKTPAKMSRAQAYTWLCKAMQLSNYEAHIGRFDIAQCQQLIEAVKQRFPWTKTAWDRLLDDDEF